MDRAFRGDKFLEIFGEGSHRRRRRNESDMFLESGEHDENSSIGVGGHIPLQVFGGTGRGGADGGAHFAEFLLRLFRSGADVFGDGFGTSFLGRHDFILAIHARALQGILPAALRRWRRLLGPEVRLFRVRPNAGFGLKKVRNRTLKIEGCRTRLFIVSGLAQTADGEKNATRENGAGRLCRPSCAKAAKNGVVGGPADDREHDAGADRGGIVAEQEMKRREMGALKINLATQ